MIYRIKRGTKIEKSQGWNVVRITTSQKVVKDTKQGCLCAVPRSIRRLKNMPQIVAFEVYKQLRKNDFSNSFDTKGRFDTGLKFFRMLESREDFFRWGLTIACFNKSGTEPVERQALIMSVKNGEYSAEGIIQYRIPQGSILGPPFFCIFINNLPLHITGDAVNCEMFANDTSLNASDINTATIRNELQKIITEVSDCCDNNALILHPAETKSMLFACCP